jgi:hypothetical protein
MLINEKRMKKKGAIIIIMTIIIRRRNFILCVLKESHISMFEATSFYDAAIFILKSQVCRLEA